MLACHPRLFPRSSLPGLCMYVWVGDIKIGARFCWGMGVFVLVLSNINIVWRKLLSAPLNGYFYTSIYMTVMTEESNADVVRKNYKTLHYYCFLSSAIMAPPTLYQNYLHIPQL